jgi:hypothetical protein
MGDRAQVQIKPSGVFLYSHWGGNELPDDVHRALSKRWRWNDEEYLARIIFDEMTAGCSDEETGFGISTSKHGDVWRLIIIDCDRQEVLIEDHGKPVSRQSFEDFVKPENE